MSTLYINVRYVVNTLDKAVRRVDIFCAYPRFWGVRPSQARRGCGVSGRRKIVAVEGSRAPQPRRSSSLVGSVSPRVQPLAKLKRRLWLATSRGCNGEELELQRGSARAPAT